MRLPIDGNPRVSQTAAQHGYGANDWAVPTGTPVYAMFDGRVTLGWKSGGGNVLDLTGTPYGRDTEAHYAHLSRYVGGNRDVREGDLIAYSGNTGTLTDGPHLHVGLTVDGDDWGPIEYLAHMATQPASGGASAITEKDDDEMKYIIVKDDRGNFALIGGVVPGVHTIQTGAVLRGVKKIVAGLLSGAVEAETLSGEEWASGALELFK